MYKRMLLAAAGLAVLLVGTGADRAGAQSRTTLDIYVVDVEGGNATLFVAPSGQSLLIDTGNFGPEASVRDAERIMAAAKDAFTQIAAKQATFASRGDKSGTHIAEINLWKAVGIDIGKDKGPWYKSIGQGMGAALNTAAASNAYVMSDRGTWISFKNKSDLVIAVEGDKRLFNQYGVMLVNPAKHPAVKKELGQAFIDWLISPEGQKAIADYKINGEQLFYPNAGDPAA